MDIYLMPNAIGSPPTGEAVGLPTSHPKEDPMKMSIESASRLLAAAYSGSEGARKRLSALVAPDRKYGIHPTKADARKYVRTLTGCKSMAADAALEDQIAGYTARKRVQAGDVLGRKFAIQSGACGSLPWASAFRVAGTLQTRMRMHSALVELTDSMEYSGETRRSAMVGWDTYAATETEKGDSYSRKCTFRKTDALHAIRQTPQAVLRLSRAVEAGLPLAMAGLVHLDATPVGTNRYRVRMARRGKGKTLTSESSLVQLMAEGDWFHAADEKGIAKEVRRRAQATEGHERIRVMFARKSITIAACRRLGWCEAGIQAWAMRWMPGAETLLEARKAPRSVVREAAARAAESGDAYGAKLLALVV